MEGHWTLQNTANPYHETSILKSFFLSFEENQILTQNNLVKNKAHPEPAIQLTHTNLNG